MSLHLRPILNIYDLYNFKIKDNNINIRFEFIKKIDKIERINLYVNNKYDEINKYKSYEKNKKIDLFEIINNNTYFKPTSYNKLAILYKLDNISIYVQTDNSYESIIINNSIIIYEDYAYIQLKFLKNYNINNKSFLNLTIICVPDNINYHISSILDKYYDTDIIYLMNIIYFIINDIIVSDKKNKLQNKYELPLYNYDKNNIYGSILFYNYHINNKFMLIPVKLIKYNSSSINILSQYKNCKCNEYQIYKNIVLNKLKNQNNEENKDNDYKEDKEDNDYKEDNEDKDNEYKEDNYVNDNKDYNDYKYTLLEYNIHRCYDTIFKNEYIYQGSYIKISDLKKILNINNKYLNVYIKKRYRY